MSKIRRLLHLPDDMSAWEMMAWVIILPLVIWGIVRIILFYLHHMRVISLDMFKG